MNAEENYEDDFEQTATVTEPTKPKKKKKPKDADVVDQTDVKKKKKKKPVEEGAPEWAPHIEIVESAPSTESAPKKKKKQTTTPTDPETDTKIKKKKKPKEIGLDSAAIVGLEDEEWDARNVITAAACEDVLRLVVTFEAIHRRILQSGFDEYFGGLQRAEQSHRIETVAKNERLAIRMQEGADRALLAAILQEVIQRCSIGQEEWEAYSKHTIVAVQNLESSARRLLMILEYLDFTGLIQKLSITANECQEISQLYQLMVFEKEEVFARSLRQTEEDASRTKLTSEVAEHKLLQLAKLHTREQTSFMESQSSERENLLSIEIHSRTSLMDQFALQLLELARQQWLQEQAEERAVLVEDEGDKRALLLIDENQSRSSMHKLEVGDKFVALGKQLLREETDARCLLHKGECSAREFSEFIVALGLQQYLQYEVIEAEWGQAEAQLQREELTARLGIYKEQRETFFVTENSGRNQLEQLCAEERTNLGAQEDSGWRAAKTKSLQRLADQETSSRRNLEEAQSQIFSSIQTYEHTERQQRVLEHRQCQRVYIHSAAPLEHPAHYAPRLIGHTVTTGRQNKVFVYGGMSEDGSLGHTVPVFNSVTHQWDPPLRSVHSRVCHSAVYWQDRLIIFGGIGPRGLDVNVTSLAGLRASREGIGGVRIRELSPTSQRVRSRLSPLATYCLSGPRGIAITPTGIVCGYLRDAIELDIAANTAKEIRTVGNVDFRACHTAVLYNDTMVVFGGWGLAVKETHRSRRLISGTGGQVDDSYDNLDTLTEDYEPSQTWYTGFEQLLNDVAELNCTTGLWSVPACSGTPPAARFGHSAVVSQRAMFIFGGVAGAAAHAGQADVPSYFNDLYTFDLDRKQWTAIAQLGAIPTPRAGHAACTYSNSMIIIGGASQQSPPELDCYQFVFATQTWREIRCHQCAVPRARAGGAVAVIHKMTAASILARQEIDTKNAAFGSSSTPIAGKPFTTLSLLLVGGELPRVQQEYRGAVDTGRGPFAAGGVVLSCGVCPPGLSPEPATYRRVAPSPRLTKLRTSRQMAEAADRFFYSPMKQHSERRQLLVAEDSRNKQEKVVGSGRLTAEQEGKCVERLHAAAIQHQQTVVAELERKYNGAPPKEQKFKSEKEMEDAVKRFYYDQLERLKEAADSSRPSSKTQKIMSARAMADCIERVYKKSLEVRQEKMDKLVRQHVPIEQPLVLSQDALEDAVRRLSYETVKDRETHLRALVQKYVPTSQCKTLPKQAIDSSVRRLYYEATGTPAPTRKSFALAS